MFSAAFTVKLAHHADIQGVDDTAFAIRYGIAAASVYVRSERGAKIMDGECRKALDQYHLARTRCGLGDLAADVTSPTISDRPIVFTNGCFDLLHAGHRQLLVQCVKDPAARALVVAVNTDESVRSLKGSDRPVRSVHSRVMDVAYAIDPEVRVKVMAFDGNVSTAIRSLGMRPAELVKGDEYSGKDIPGSELCDTVTLYPMVEGHSTSRLVGR
jgi:D-beta-D-heptose 7-phosphate kinase/D-beta-D-heptose 1-phosphate adenosyltransferase